MNPILLIRNETPAITAIAIAATIVNLRSLIKKSLGITVALANILEEAHIATERAVNNSGILTTAPNPILSIEGPINFKASANTTKIAATPKEVQN